MRSAYRNWERRDGRHRCDCCGELFTKNAQGDVLSCIDHNHTTGVVRGVICVKCNSKFRELTAVHFKYLQDFDPDEVKRLAYELSLVMTPKPVIEAAAAAENEAA